MAGGYELKVDTDKLNQQKENLKKGFLSIHNGLVNIEKALDGIDTKGMKGKAGESVTELMNVVKSDVIAPTDRYNDIVIANLNVAFMIFEEL